MITRKQLSLHLHYDPKTGLFWWIKSGLARQKNKPAGTIREDGYVLVCFAYKQYYAHRLAWLLMTGKWPAKEIDHKDGNPANNRWNNLRAANRANQLQNSRIKRSNTSGYKGACWAEKESRWLASITLNGKNKFLGYYSTKELAHAAYADAAKKHFGEFARAR